MLGRILDLVGVENWRSIEWYKNGERAALRTMRVFGDTESGAVRVEVYYRTPILSILITRRVYVSSISTPLEGDGPGKYRAVSSLWVVTLGTRGGRPLVSFHLPSRVRRVASDEAVEEVQRLISENTDFNFTACTLHN